MRLFNPLYLLAIIPIVWIFCGLYFAAFVVAPLVIALVLVLRSYNQGIETYSVEKEKVSAFINQVLIVITSIGAFLAIGDIPFVGQPLEFLVDLLGLAQENLDILWTYVVGIIDVGLLIVALFKSRFVTKAGATLIAHSKQLDKGVNAYSNDFKETVQSLMKEAA